MEGGDISNLTPPRFLFVYDGLIGTIESAAQQKKERFYITLRRWDKAVACRTINETALSYIWDIAWRWNMQIDIVTFLPYHEAIHRQLEEEGVPFSNFRHYVRPEVLAMKLAYMPYVHRVYFSEPKRRFLFGDRGVYVPTMEKFDPTGS